MNIHLPANEQALQYLTRRLRGEIVPEVRVPREGQRDYWESGAHPDIVERLWDQLGKNLPSTWRQVVLGAPALLNPNSGLLIAVAIGTNYVLRLLPNRLSEALATGARTKTVFTKNHELDVTKEFGPDWIIGQWSSVEEVGCLEFFQSPEN